MNDRLIIRKSNFRSIFNLLLANVPFTAFRRETRAVTRATVTQPFEFVLLDSPGLARRPDQKAFAKHFTEADADIAVFPNSGGMRSWLCRNGFATIK